MDDDFQLWSLGPPHSTAYYYGDELEIHVTALNDFRSSVYLDGYMPPVAAWERPINFAVDAPPSCTSPNSPSSVAYLPSCYPPSPLKPIPIEHQVVIPEVLHVTGDASGDLIKSEPEPFEPKPFEPKPLEPKPLEPKPFEPKPFEYPEPTYYQPLQEVASGYSSDDERERLRRRQRGYEKRYRGRKRRDLKLLRETWLGLEMKLAAARKKHCHPSVRVRLDENKSLQCKLELLRQEERALHLDYVTLRSLKSWEEVSRIREYTDKDELRTVSEWQHNAEKVIGQGAMLAPHRFNPYAPMELNFTW